MVDSIYRGLIIRSLTVILTAAAVCGCGREEPDTPPQKPVQALPQPAQDVQRAYNIDKSPMDLVYFPPDYPILKMTGTAEDQPVARCIYSRPSKDGRVIFGEVVKYGEYWRLGANEGTEIEFFRDVDISGTRVKKGRYIIYCIPQRDRWTLKLNDDLFTWGLRIHGAMDLYSFDVPAENNGPVYEVFTIEFQQQSKGARLMMAWDSTKAYLPFTY